MGIGRLGGRAGDLKHNLLDVKRTVMTFGYEAYASPDTAQGRFFLSKLVFTNPGRGPVRNFQISNQVPGYIPWTTPETQAEIVPGQTLVKVFYPKFPAAVAALVSR